jgi:hypothetical protein
MAVAAIDGFYLKTVKSAYGREPRLTAQFEVRSRSQTHAVLFLPVACLVVLMEQVRAKVPCEVPPHRVDVVGVVLRVV